MQAVITADIVNSTFLRPSTFEALIKNIKANFRKPDQVEFYRGDSFQALIADGGKAFLSCLLCRLEAIALTTDQRIDIRQSISLGTIKGKVNHLGSHIEDVFISSGRTFDKLADSGRRLLITNGNPDDDFILEVIARYADSLLSQVTPKQATILYHLLSGRNQAETAKLLKKTTATINQHVKRSRFDEIQILVREYELFINKVAYGK